MFMKAIVYDDYGPPDGLRLEEVERPVPADDQVLVKIHAASLNRSDWEALTGKPLYVRVGGLSKPGNRILGSDIAGTVEAAGKDIKRFRPGDQVFGLLFNYAGGFAEYVCCSENGLALKPAELTFEQAAAIPQAAFIALQGIIAKGQVRAGQKVLINGAGGGTGSFAIQLARSAGAEVTGVDNAEKLEFMRSLGADHVIDHTREDFTKNGRQYDLILDLIATRPASALPRALARNGTYFFVGGSVGIIFQILFLGPLIKRIAHRNIRMLLVQTDPKDLLVMAEMISSGKVRLMIDKTYSLNETPEALRYLGEGHARGKIVIAVE
jgi:NADPH:quinone reductase-like Zn-dependent oxidoreductase